MAGKMDNVVFLKVDINEAKDVASLYNISMPTFVFIKDVNDGMGMRMVIQEHLVNSS